MRPLPMLPRLRASFSFTKGGELEVELVLMDQSRTLVHRTKVIRTSAPEVLQAHRVLLGMVALDGVQRGIFDLPAALRSAQEPPAESSAVEPEPAPGPLTSEEREQARSAALERFDGESEPEPELELEPESVELAALVLTTEEREQARSAALERFDVGPSTPRDGPPKLP